MTGINRDKLEGFCRALEKNITTLDYDHTSSVESIVQSFILDFAELVHDHEIPIKVVFPAFYKLDAWEEWCVSPFDKLSYAYMGENTKQSVNQIFSPQDELGELLNNHFTQTVISELETNDRTIIRVGVNPSLSEQLYSSKSDGAGVKIFYVNQRLLFEKLKVNDPKYAPKYDEFDKQIEFKIDNIGIDRNDESESIWRIDDKSNLLKLVKEWNNIDKLLIPALTHSLYANDTHDLIYVFSNIVKNVPFERQGDRKRSTGLGGLFLIVDKSIDAPILYDYLSIVVDRLALRITNHYSHQTIIEKSIKSAITAIMARNGSHNIGSHVLSAVSNKINSLPDDRVLFEYIQQRMDFIAQIPTGIPHWTTGTWFIKDLMKRFYSQVHLLDNIVASEGLAAYEFQSGDGKKGPDHQSNKIIIKVRKKGSKEFIIDRKIDEEGKIDDDVQIAIPGGVIGQHAFYTILENIIRNAAKHGWSTRRKRPQNLEMTIEWEEDNSSDDVIFRIWDNVSKISNIKREIQIPLARSFIDHSDGRLLPENWGLAELKICAGFLNRAKYELIGSNNEKEILFCEANKSGLISPIGKKDGTDFGYVFKIPKPKELLIVGAVDHKDFEAAEKAELNKYSITFCHEFPKDLDYSMILVIQNGNIKIPETVLMPMRVLEVDTEFNLLNSSTDYKMKRPELFYKSQKDGELLVSLSNYYSYCLGYWIQVAGYHLAGTDVVMEINLEGEAGSNQDRQIDLLVDDIFLEEVGDSQIVRKLRRGMFENRKVAITNLYEPEYHSLFDHSNHINRYFLALLSEEEAEKYRASEFYKKRGVFRRIAKALLYQYEENYRTLPRVFRAGVSTGDKNRSVPLGENVLSIANRLEGLVPHVSFKRHDVNDEAMFYKEAVSGSQSFYGLLQNMDGLSDSALQKTYLALYESALVHLVVLDERIDKYVRTNMGMKERLLGMNIEVPGIDFDSICGLKNCISELTKTANHSIIIIHQGIVDKLTGQRNQHKPMVEFVEVFSKEIKGGELFITSGRGTPDKIPYGVKFVPYSNLESFLLKAYPEKYLLTEMLLRIRNEGK